MTLNTVEERQRFIGGTDIAGILGLSRWKTPLSVWAEKTGQVQQPESKGLWLTLGTRLEEVVAELFMEETGKKLIRANERRVHPKYPMFAAQIDRLVVNEDAVWEGKTTSAWKKKEWIEDEIPQEYVCQVMWQLAITGRKLGYISCLIGNEQFVTKKIERDPVMIAEMLRRAETFWNDFILPVVMPMQVTDTDTAILKALFPQAELGKTLDIGVEGAKLCELRAMLTVDAINLEKQIERATNELKALLRDAESAEAGKYSVFWKNQHRKGYTKVVEPTDIRVFTVKEKKEP